MIDRHVNSFTVDHGNGESCKSHAVKDDSGTEINAGMRFPFPTHSIKLEMLWELMRLYDWRIITYISSSTPSTISVEA